MSFDNTMRVEHAERVGVVPGFERVRWGAVFAGLFFTIVAQILLAVLGLAIGFTAADPKAGAPGSAFAWGAAIWGVLSLLISLFIGAYMTGRLSNVPTRGDGALNGALTWAVSLVAMLYLVGAGVGSLASGVFGVVGGAANTAAVVAGQSAGNGRDIASQAKDVARSAGIDVDELKQQAQRKAEQAQGTAERATQPGTPENQQAREVADKATDYAAAGAWSMLVGALLGLAVAAWAGALGASAGARPGTLVRS
jgi:hypothetical protein